MFTQAVATQMHEWSEQRKVFQMCIKQTNTLQLNTVWNGYANILQIFPWLFLSFFQILPIHIIFVRTESISSTHHGRVQHVFQNHLYFFVLHSVFVHFVIYKTSRKQNQKVQKSIILNELNKSFSLRVDTQYTSERRADFFIALIAVKLMNRFTRRRLGKRVKCAAAILCRLWDKRICIWNKRSKMHALSNNYRVHRRTDVISFVLLSCRSTGRTSTQLFIVPSSFILFYSLFFYQRCKWKRD